MNDKNTIIAIVLSALVLIGWQYFIGGPQMERQRQEAQLKQQQQQQAPAPGAPGTAPTPGTAPAPGAAPTPGTAPQAPGTAAPPSQIQTRATVLAAGPRIAIDTPSVKGSIALKGARIDDLALTQYRDTVDPKSPAVVLLSPSGAEHPFYAEFGWVPGQGTTAKLPDANTVWTQEGAGALAPGADRRDGLEVRAHRFEVDVRVERLEPRLVDLDARLEEALQRARHDHADVHEFLALDARHDAHHRVVIRAVIGHGSHPPGTRAGPPGAAPGS